MTYESIQLKFLEPQKKKLIKDVRDIETGAKKGKKFQYVLNQKIL